MYVMICRLDLMILEGNSLKEKRQVTRSIIERMQHRFNISVAEVGHLEALRRAEIGVAMVSNKIAHLEKMTGKLLCFVESDGRVEVISIEKEIY